MSVRESVVLLFGGDQAVTFQLPSEAKLEIPMPDEYQPSVPFGDLVGTDGARVFRVNHALLSLDYASDMKPTRADRVVCYASDLKQARIDRMLADSAPAMFRENAGACERYRRTVGNKRYMPTNATLSRANLTRLVAAYAAAMLYALDDVEMHLYIHRMREELLDEITHALEDVVGDMPRCVIGGGDGMCVRFVRPNSDNRAYVHPLPAERRLFLNESLEYPYWYPLEVCVGFGSGGRGGQQSNRE